MARIIGLLTVIALLVMQLPVFLQQTLTPDAVMYDLQARCALNGGVLYRDIVEPNLPGVVWVHAAWRSIAGWSPVALRVLDLCVVMASCWLLAHLVSWSAQSDRSHPSVQTDQSRRPAIVSPWLMFVLLAFYFGTTEWCHCQRDVWMLLPALIAVKLRLAWLVVSDTTPARDIRSGLWEGIVWACGFWLKPFIAVPAIAIVIVSLRFAPSRRAWVRQLLAMLAGGMMIGAAGILWMIWSGCWPWFVDTLTNWNGRYFASGRERWTWTRMQGVIGHFQPWVILHLGAIACVAVEMRRRAKCERRQVVSPLPQIGGARTEIQSNRDSSGAMLSALYLGWMLQACLFQQPFDYVHVPGMLLSIGLCGLLLQRIVIAAPMQTALVRTVTASFVLVAVLASGLILPERLRHWPSCVHAMTGMPLNPSLRDAISRTPLPRWKELQPMLDHIAAMNPADRSVLAHSCYLIHVYPELQLTPPTRFVYLDVLARLFPDRREEMVAAVAACGAEWVIADLAECGWEEPVPDGELLPSTMTESEQRLFPWNQTPVFRSGGYVLLRLDQPVGELSHESMPLSAD